MLTNLCRLGKDEAFSKSVLRCLGPGSGQTRLYGQHGDLQDCALRPVAHKTTLGIFCAPLTFVQWYYDTGRTTKKQLSLQTRRAKKSSSSHLVCRPRFLGASGGSMPGEQAGRVLAPHQLRLQGGRGRRLAHQCLR